MLDDSKTVEELDTLDPSKFRVSAQDIQGHKERKYIAMSPMLANAIGVLVAGKRFPYKTEGELIRHALVRHIKWLEHIEDVPSVSGQLEAMNRVLYEDQLNEEFLDTFNRAAPRLANFISLGDYNEARRLFEDLLKHVNRMPEGYWKRRSLKKLWDEHGWVMRSEYDQKTVTVSLAIENSQPT